MSDADYIMRSRKVIQMLQKHQLLQALELQKEELAELNDWKYTSEYDNISEAYNALLSFMGNGVSDPDRTTMRLQLLQRAYNLQDNIAYSFGMRHSAKLFYEKRRTQTAAFPTLALEELVTEINGSSNLKTKGIQTEEKTPETDQEQRKHLDSLCNELFTWLWTSPQWRMGEASRVKDLLDTLQPNIVATCMSALFLHLTEMFDYERLNLLLLYCQSETPLLRQRALVSAVMAIIRHAERLADFPKIQMQLAALAEEPRFVNELCELQTQLFLTLESRNAERKMREEIIPDLLKSNRFRATKFGFEEVDPALTQEDENPDWKQQMEEQKIDKRMNELMQMQQDGLDLYMGTFSTLKHYPFFQAEMNWFYPFDPQRDEIKDVLLNKDGKPSLVFNSFLNSGTLCDSDKYSFCFIARLIPPQQLKMIETKIGEAMNGEDESIVEKLLKPDEISASELRKTYLQDLYRFFKLHTRHIDFYDPFENNLYLMDVPQLAWMLDSVDSLHRLANFMLHWKYYTNALRLFQQLAAKSNATAEIFQKMGYCCQMEKNYTRAIGYYRQSDILNPDVAWTLRHTAQCYRHIGQTEQALQCYLKLETMEPDNLNLLMLSGECQVLMKQYDEAFARFFKVDYLDTKSLRAARAIAWCSFLTGKLDQTEKYYKRILSQSPNANADDWLNAGHTAWANQDIKMAISRYTQYLRLTAGTNGNRPQTVNFDADRKELNEKGITDEDIEIMQDYLRIKNQ